MTKYKVIMIYSNGDRDEQDELFSSEWEAEQHALYLIGCHREGGEIMKLSNFSEFEVDEEDPDYEIIEIDEED